MWDGETCQTKLREFIDEIFLEAGLCHSMTEGKTPVTGQRAARIAFVSLPDATQWPLDLLLNAG